jgi:hypothetical protein
MATARAMILRALRMNGEKSRGGTLTTAEESEHLADLNSMLESWSTNRLFVYQIVEEQFNLVVNQSSYTIGSSGNFNTTRPVKIEDTCFINYQSTKFPVSVVDDSTFTGFQTVGLSDRPRNLYYDISVPLGTIKFDYKADSTYEFHLKSWKQLQTFATIDTDVTFPIGYRRAIESNYAIESAPGFKPVQAEVIKIAKESIATIQRLNVPEFRLSLDAGVAGHFGSGSIFTGL